MKLERTLNGEAETDKRVRTDHERQRENFCYAWEKGEVRSESEASEKRPYTPYASRGTR